MFTGIIEEIGTVSRIERGARSARLTIRCKKVLEETKIGDSIAVNGACLTAAALGADFFSADVMPETMTRTGFSLFREGSPVNLERAMAIGDRLGGHIVTGHIDGTGRIERISKAENATLLTISFAPEKMKYVVEKGSVTLDGVSLTVAKRDGRSFTVSIIPHTGGHTILLAKHVGDPVNVECDILGKYMEQILASGGGLTMELLRKTLG